MDTTNFRGIPKEEAPKVILFDLWRTLCLSLDKEPIKDLQGILGHNMYPGPHGMEAELDPAFLRECLTTNECNPEKFLSVIAHKFGYAVAPDALKKFQDILARESCGLARYADVDETVAGLKQLGYRRLGVVSNLWPFPEHRIFGCGGFGDNFEHRVYSYTVGHRKPDPEIFLEACTRFRVRPQDCLMVGDHPKADIEGALAVGMRAALIDRPGECGNVQIPGVRVMRTLTELLELPSLV